MYEEDTFDGLLSAIELCELINQDLFTEYSTHPTNDRVESSKTSRRPKPLKTRILEK